MGVNYAVSAFWVFILLISVGISYPATAAEDTRDAGITDSPAPLNPARSNDGHIKTWTVVVTPYNTLKYLFMSGDDRVLTAAMSGWGPHWGYVGALGAKAVTTDNEMISTFPFVIDKVKGQIINVSQKVRKSADQDVSFEYDLSSNNDVPLTKLAASINFENGFMDSEIVLRHPAGTEEVVSSNGVWIKAEISTVVFRPKGHGEFTATIDPPVTISCDHGLRLELAKDIFKAGSRSTTIVFHFSEKPDLIVNETAVDKYCMMIPGEDWFPATTSNDFRPSVIGFEGWLDKPAGVHGAVRMIGDHFEFEDHTAVKFWGTNLGNNDCAPNKEQAERTAARFAKFGINSVRLHKWSAREGGIGDPNDATQMTKAGLDRLDYFSSQLSKNGIYYGWSEVYRFLVAPGNRAQLLNYDEIMKASSRGSTGDGFIDIAEDCQDLMIKMVVNLLNHKNPYTGKTYAQDPALAFIECQNEDDIFFYTTYGLPKRYPTYWRKIQDRFNAWLLNKYSNQAGLERAWGKALRSSETLAGKSIELSDRVWEFSNPLGDQRILDNEDFLHWAQDAYYSKFVAAVRNAGYQGPLIGSPWQTPPGLPNYYNIKSDHDVGYIDRHNYFGTGHLNETMLNKPGSGYFSSGFQRALDRPFGLSEWTTQYPCLYSAEGPAIVSVYGLGLQDWNSSYEFYSWAGLSRQFTDKVYGGGGPWNVDVPTQIGQFPALARMIMRGDIKKGDVIGVRSVTPHALSTGKFDFTDEVTQEGDIKSFSGDIPSEALAAGRIGVKFPDKEEPSVFPEMAKYEQNKVITSDTGQLVWDYSDKGYFTVNSDGTKAVVGFARDKAIRLGSYNITAKSPYVSIFLTSLERGKDLAQCKTALLTAVARISDSGFKVFTLDDHILDPGKAPILVEPVKAEIGCGKDIATVYVLDLNGHRVSSPDRNGDSVDRTLSIDRNHFAIDTGQDKTIYYEVVFK